MRVRVGNAEYLIFSHPIPQECGALAGLTPAERIVAHLALTGASNDRIAEDRCSSPATVAKQLQSIYRKLGINSRAELAALVHGPTVNPQPVNGEDR